MFTVLQKMIAHYLELLKIEREKQETGAIYVMRNFIFHEY